MFRNVVPARELLSNSFSERQDTQDHSSDRQQYSQLAYSQPDFSQISSQDMFTQQIPLGSHNEVINNVTTSKPTLYDKWKSKTSAPFRQVPVDKGGVSSLANRPSSQTKPDLSFQHQLQINKAKAKERDERDFLQQVVNTVQDCSKEVKLTLCSICEKIERDGEKSGENLQHTITSFLDDLCKHQERILCAVQEKDNNSTKCHELEKELALRDARIQSLEKTIEEHKKDTPEKIIHALQKQLHSPQQKFDNKLSELLETIRENHEQYIQQIQEQKQQLEEQQKLYSDLKKAQQTQIKDSEKRLINEVSNLRKEIRKKETTCLQDILEQLKSAQEEQFEDLEKQIGVLVDSSAYSETGKHKDQSLQKKEVQDLLKKHWGGVEKIIETQFKKHLKLQEEQLSIVVDKLAETDSQNKCDSFLSLPQFEDKMGKYHEDFRKQVESLHNRHLQEIKHLRSEMEAKGKEKPMFPAAVQKQAAVVMGERFNMGLNSETNRTNENEKRYTYNANEKDFPAIVSPLTANYKKLNTRTFFSKTAFSPVATVLPQRKETTQLGISTLTQNKQMTDETVPHVDSNSTKKKKPRRKKKSKFSKPKKKPALPKVPLQIIATQDQTMKMKEPENASPLCDGSLSNNVISGSRALNENMSLSPDVVSKKMSESGMKSSVYDFRDEDIPEACINKNRNFFGRSTHSYSYNSKNKELTTVNASQTVTFPRPSVSPCTDIVSRDSSPSLSITEVVVKRRIKCDKRTPDINLHFNQSGFGKLGPETRFPVYDILSTPTINTVSNQQNKGFWTYKQNMSQKPIQPVRRAGEKRRLCDTDIRDNIIQTFRNQNRI